MYLVVRRHLLGQTFTCLGYIRLSLPNLTVSSLPFPIRINKQENRQLPMLHFRVPTVRTMLAIRRRPPHLLNKA